MTFIKHDMRYSGRIADWNDERGFGFVTPSDGRTRAFVHVKAFSHLAKRPVTGDLISYELQKDEQGRLNAAKIKFAELRSQSRPTLGMPLLRKSMAVLFFLLLLMGIWQSAIPDFVLLVYALMSALAVFAYGMDKSAAVKQLWRTKESSLHLIALLGGWPGALFAQDLFRHKSKKTSFQITFWITAALNCGMLAWLVIDGQLLSAIEQQIRAF